MRLAKCDPPALQVLKRLRGQFRRLEIDDTVAEGGQLSGTI